MNSRALARLRSWILLILLCTSSTGFAASEPGPQYDRIFRHPASDGADPEHLPRAFFGPSGNNTLSLSALAGMPRDNVSAAAVQGDRARIYCTASCIVYFPVKLPSGVRIDSVGANVYDADDEGRIEVALSTCAIQGSEDCLQISSAATGIGPTVGASIITDNTNYTVDNTTHSLLLEVRLFGDSPEVAFKNVMVSWKRQISPAPGSATFNDVAVGHAFFQSIEALAASGVTSGCGDGNYCPDAIVTRGQMAAFLARALGL